MLRHRLVRQSAVSTSSTSTESGSMPSPQPVRQRRSSQDSKMYKQLSSDSLHLLNCPEVADVPMKKGGRRHSVACGILYGDIQKPSLKAAINTALKRVSGACSLLSSAPSSTYNLSSHQRPEPPKKEEEVLLPSVLGTFRQNQRNQNCSNNKRNRFQVNRRFSTDCPPPSYSEATNLWKQPVQRQKLLTRQHEVVASNGSLMALEDDDVLIE